MSGPDLYRILSTDRSSLQFEVESKWEGRVISIRILILNFEYLWYLNGLQKEVEFTILLVISLELFYANLQEWRHGNETSVNGLLNRSSCKQFSSVNDHGVFLTPTITTLYLKQRRRRICLVWLAGS